MSESISVDLFDGTQFPVKVKDIYFICPYPDYCEIGLYNGNIIKAQNRLDKRYRAEKKTEVKNLRQLFNNPFVSKY